MEMKLELVLIPVADVDRAKRFYVERLGLLKTSTCGRRRASGSCS
jgi:catechol 2,3-dioxygenase-like lactoylglutathione lyase family enzyme